MNDPGSRETFSHILTHSDPKIDTAVIPPLPLDDRYAPGTRVYYQWNFSYLENGQNITAMGDLHSFVVPRRITVALLGDSYASGEGAPRETGLAWQVTNDGTRAHRSFYSGQELAVRSFFDNRLHLAWDYINVSSSGAIAADVYSDQAQRNRDGSGVGYPQLNRVRTWLEARDYSGLDAAVISIGGNDMGFSTVIKNYLGLNVDRIERFAKDSYEDPDCATLTQQGLDLCSRIPIIGRVCKPAATVNRAVVTAEKVANFIVNGVVQDYSFKIPYNAIPLTRTSANPQGSARHFSWYENRLRAEYTQLGAAFDQKLDHSNKRIRPSCVLVTEYPDLLKGCNSFFEDLSPLALFAEGRQIQISRDAPCATANCFLPARDPIVIQLPDLSYLRTGFSTTETAEARFELGPQVSVGSGPSPGGVNHTLRDLVEDLDQAYPATDWEFIETSASFSSQSGICFSGRYFNTLNDALDLPGPDKIDNAFHPNRRGHNLGYKPRILAGLTNALTKQKLTDLAIADGLSTPDALLPDLRLISAGNFSAGSNPNTLQVQITPVNGGTAASPPTTIHVAAISPSDGKIGEVSLPVGSLDPSRGDGRSGVLPLPARPIISEIPEACGPLYPGFDHEAFVQKDRVLRYFWSFEDVVLRSTIDPTKTVRELDENNNQEEISFPRPVELPSPALQTDINSVLADLSQTLGRAITQVRKEDLFSDTDIREFFGYYLVEEKNGGVALRLFVQRMVAWRRDACFAENLGRPIPEPPVFDPGLCDGLRPLCSTVIDRTFRLKKSTNVGWVLDEFQRVREFDGFIAELIEDAREAVISVQLEPVLAEIMGNPLLELTISPPNRAPGLRDLRAGAVLPLNLARFQPEDFNENALTRLMIGDTKGARNLYQGIFSRDPETGQIGLTAANLPTDGRTIYATTESIVGGKVVSSTIPLRTQARNARLQLTESSQFLPSEEAVVRWTPADPAVAAGPIEAYSLMVGSMPGFSDVYPGLNQDGQPFENRTFSAETTSVTLGNLPRDGRRLHALLGTRRDGVWRYETYQLAGADRSLAMLQLPKTNRPMARMELLKFTPGHQEEGSYQVRVGTRRGGNDLLDRSDLTASQTSEGIPLNLRDFRPQRDDEGRVLPLWITIESGLGTSSFPWQPSPHSGLTQPQPWQPVEADELELRWAVAEGARRLMVVALAGNGETVFRREFSPDQQEAAVPFPRGTNSLTVQVLTDYGEGQETATAMTVTTFRRAQSNQQFFAGDDLPDLWQYQNFGPSGRNARPDDDPDGDGQSNLIEFLAGTNPISPGDRLQMTPVFDENGMLSGQVVTLPSFQTNYQLQATTGLNEEWRNVGPVRRAEDADGNYQLRFPLPAVDPNDPEGNAFYRIRLVPRED